MTTDLREKIAEVLAGHRDVIGRKVVRCECGDWAFAYEVLGITEVAGEHRRHVAEAILAAIGDWLRELAEMRNSSWLPVDPYAFEDPRDVVARALHALADRLPVDTEDRALTEGQTDG